MPNNSNRNRHPPSPSQLSTTAPSPRVSTHPADYPEEAHDGTFAEGECEPEAHPEEEHVGTFAEGECEPKPTPRKSTSARSPRAKSAPEAHPVEEHVGALAEVQKTRP